MKEIMQLSFLLIWTTGLFSMPRDHHRHVSHDAINLLLFYGSFDENKNGELSLHEITEFYSWCQHEIVYHAHDGYQSPVKTYRESKGDCLDISLFIAYFLRVFSYEQVFIGDVAADNQGKKANHACCLLLISIETKNDINKKLGYDMHYFRHADEELCYIIIDPLFSDRFGRVDSDDHYLKSIGNLSEYRFSDMPNIITTQ